MQKKLRDLLSSAQFSIPSYQRDYAWSRENFQDLWEDLKEQVEADSEGHFLGTIVVSPNAKDPKKLDIIDGQQRLTTIYMLLYAMIHSDENLKAQYESLLKIGENLRLEVADFNKDFFENLLKNRGKIDSKINGDDENNDISKGQERLCNVATAIFRKIDEEQVRADMHKYCEALLDMVLMQYEEKDPGRAIRTFQSINDRGVPLRILDKLKALLIYHSNLHCGGELDEMISKSFGEIFASLDRIEKYKKFKYESDLFYHHAGSKAFEFSSGVKFLGDYKDTRTETYEKLKDELAKFIKNGQKPKLKSFIKDYTSDLQAFHKTFLELMIEKGQNPSLTKLFTLEKISSVFYPAIVRFRINNALDDELIDLMIKADIIMLKTGLELKAEAYSLIQNAQDKASFTEAVRKKCGKHVDKRIEYIATNAYDIAKSAFYYLFFEQNCTQGNDKIDIKQYIKLRDEKELQREHIISQKIVNEQKALAFGFANLSEIKSHLHHWGNLLALEKALNIAASNKDTYGKSAEYEKSQIPFVQYFEVKSFDKAALDRRDTEFKKWAKGFFTELMD